MIKSDAQLTQEVEQELASEPKLNASGIAIKVDQGAVSLLGTIDGPESPGHHGLDADFAQQCPLSVGGHRHISIGNHANGLLLAIGNHHAPNIPVPHELSGLLERGVRTAGCDVSSHQFFGLHWRGQTHDACPTLPRATLP
jgi:hypothetical protein